MFFFGTTSKKTFNNIPRDIHPEDLIKLLSKAYSKNIEVYQYEDDVKELIRVNSTIELLDAFNIYDQMKRVLTKEPATLNLYLRDSSNSPSNGKNLMTSSRENLSPSSILKPNNNNNTNINNNLENNETKKFTSPKTTNPISIKKSKEDNTVTPPLRTPPPSPPPEKELQTDVPLLRTPPPSPPHTQGPLYIRTPPPSNPGSEEENEVDEQEEEENEKEEKNLKIVTKQAEEEEDEEDEDSDDMKDVSDENSSSDEETEMSETLMEGEGNFQNLKWKNGGLIGKGGFGNVYQGLNPITGEWYAVKRIEIDTTNTQKTKMGIASYKQEIDVMKNLNHPNIVRYLGTKIGKGKHKNIMYIFLEYCSGGSIRSMLTKFGSFEENLIRSYSKQILDGLLYLHSNNIIHRDIKGANLLVKDHKVKLADFGCAKIFAGLTPISNAKSILGTPFWMAPEVIRAKGYGISADIWSFGCTLIEMACGQPPWADQFTEPTAAMFHVADSTEPPKIPLNLGKDASDFILQCFKRNPKERPTAKNLLDSPWIISSDSSETKKKNKRKTVRSSDDRDNEKNAEDPTHKHNSNNKNIFRASFDIHNLSTEILLHIFNFLPISKLCDIATICKTWKGCVADDMIWRFKVLSKWKKKLKKTKKKRNGTLCIWNKWITTKFGIIKNYLSKRLKENIIQKM